MIARIPARADPLDGVRALRLGGGELVHIRQLLPSDRAAVDELHRRCSPHTLTLRYFTPLVRLPNSMFARMCDRSHGWSVAVLTGRRMVALAHLMFTTQHGVGDAALLIEDDWQGRGLGTALTKLLVNRAAEQGISDLHADIRADNHRMGHILRRLGGTDSASDDKTVVAIHLKAAQPPPEPQKTR